MRYYLDSTVITHAVGDLPESEELREWLAQHSGEVVTSVLARWEASEELLDLDRVHRMRLFDQLGGIPQIPISGRALEIGAYAVAAVSPYSALHVGLAAAEETVSVMVTYSAEVASAARLYGLRVITPGRDASWYLG